MNNYFEMLENLNLDLSLKETIIAKIKKMVNNIKSSPETKEEEIISETIKIVLTIHEHFDNQIKNIREENSNVNNMFQANHSKLEEKCNKLEKENGNLNNMFSTFQDKCTRLEEKCSKLEEDNYKINNKFTQENFKLNNTINHLSEQLASLSRQMSENSKTTEKIVYRRKEDNIFGLIQKLKYYKNSEKMKMESKSRSMNDFDIEKLEYRSENKLKIIYMAKIRSMEELEKREISHEEEIQETQEFKPEKQSLNGIWHQKFSDYYRKKQMNNSRSYNEFMNQKKESKQIKVESALKNQQQNNIKVEEVMKNQKQNGSEIELAPEYQQQINNNSQENPLSEFIRAFTIPVAPMNSFFSENENNEDDEISEELIKRFE